MPKIELRWWESRKLDGFAEPDYVNHESCFVVEECQISTEEIVEYPDDCDRLTDEQWEAIKNSLGGRIDGYHYLWSTCPGTKIGGYPDFGGQDPCIPVDSSGKELSYLLTISDNEWDRGSYRRWMPMEQEHPPFGRHVLEETTDENGHRTSRSKTVYTQEEKAELDAWPHERWLKYEADRNAIGTFLKNPLNVFCEPNGQWTTA